MPQSPANTNRDASAAAGSEYTANTAHPGQPDEAGVDNSSTKWELIATFDSMSDYEQYKKSHSEGFRSGKNRKGDSGCVLSLRLPLGP